MSKLEHLDIYLRQGSNVSGLSKGYPQRVSRAEESAKHVDKLLKALGYTSELKRSRLTLSVAFMLFVLALVPYRLSITLYYPLTRGGPTIVI